jgi:hypothetical protein
MNKFVKQKPESLGSSDGWKKKGVRLVQQMYAVRV